MKCILALFFLPLCAFADTGKQFVAMTTESKQVKPISPQVFDSIKPPVSLGSLVLLWGKAYVSPHESAGVIHWYCSDGRSAMAWPRSYKADEILSSTGNAGRGWLKFNGKQDAPTYTSSSKTIIKSTANAEQGAAANP
jgi:hypothetical protein